MALPSTVGEALAHAQQWSVGSHTGLTPTVVQALLAHVVGRGRAWLLAHRESALSASEAARFVTLLERASVGEPLAYLLGEREFCGLAFSVTPDVLVPRPETEAVVDTVLDWIRERNLPVPRLVDVGTGSGAIAITLAVKLPSAQVAAVEISWDAILIAAYNATRHGVIDRVGLVVGDLLGALVGPFDAIAANLPYINREELAALEVGRWEPRVALDGGDDGLVLVRRLLAQAPARLVPGGLLVLEVGQDQGLRVTDLCHMAFPQAQISVLPDLAGLDRIVVVETT